jgi:isoprenylcysteine carboxyl methyltransferase (ICMT) family protein YpbQ
LSLPFGNLVLVLASILERVSVYPSLIDVWNTKISCHERVDYPVFAMSCLAAMLFEGCWEILGGRNCVFSTATHSTLLLKLVVTTVKVTHASDSLNI